MLPTTGPAPRRRNLPDFASQMLAGMVITHASSAQRSHVDQLKTLKSGIKTTQSKQVKHLKIIEISVLMIMKNKVLFF